MLSVLSPASSNRSEHVKNPSTSHKNHSFLIDHKEKQHPAHVRKETRLLLAAALRTSSRILARHDAIGSRGGGETSTDVSEDFASPPLCLLACSSHPATLPSLPKAVLIRRSLPFSRMLRRAQLQGWSALGRCFVLSRCAPRESVCSLCQRKQLRGAGLCSSA